MKARELPPERLHFFLETKIGALMPHMLISNVQGGLGGFVKFPRKKPMIAAVDGYALAGGKQSMHLNRVIFDPSFYRM